MLKYVFLKCSALIVSLALVVLGTAQAAVKVGQPAPALTLIDVQGTPVSLDQFKGRWLALEWVNPSCPFVQKHYNSGNMQKTQRVARELNVRWLQISSTNSNHPEFRDGPSLMAWNVAMKSLPALVALDADGKTGRAYGAKTTPEMVLINPEGIVVYHGAIDSIRSASTRDIALAVNYMEQAMREATAGKPVSVPESQPYGCSIKY
jgi:peroxiredoxin